MTGLGLDPAYEVPAERYEGVAGWLLLFCLDLTLFIPGSLLYRVVGHTIPMLARTHDLKRELLWSVYILMLVSIAGLAFVTGVRLWMVRRGAVRMARLWLMMGLCLHVSYFFLWLVMFWHRRTDSVAKMAWDHIVAQLIPFCVWSAYLTYSKRVRDTYGEVDRVTG